MGGADYNYFEIGKTGTAISDCADQARSEFAKQRALLCRRAISQELLDRMVQATERAHFASDSIKGVGHRYIERPSIVGAALELAINRSNLLHWLADATCRPVTSRIEGRLVKTRPGGEDRLDWHDDHFDGKQLGFTAHLRPCGYHGGAFELRDKASKSCLFRHEQAEPGDIAIFDVSARSEHRVLPIETGQSRLVFTGWLIGSHLL